MGGAPLAVSLRLARPVRRAEEFTLFPDKVRVEWRKPFGSGTTEIPLRFLDPTWAAQKGSGPLGRLAGGALLGAFGLLLLWASLRLPRPDGIALLATSCLMVLAGLGLFGSWWLSRFDVIVFTSLHPQYGPLVIHRTKACELETLQFADAVSERIKLFALTKPEG